MTTTIASLLKRLEAEEGRRVTGDNELRGFINKLGVITDGLNEQDIATDKRLGIVEDNLATLEARAFPVELPPLPEEPGPPPVEPPLSEKPERIWNSISDWHIKWPSRPGAITEETYEGRRALKMAVLSSDGSPGGTTSTTRAQLETEGFLKEGETAFFRGRFYLPGNFPNPAPGWGVNLAEIYAEKGDGSPPWQIQVRGDRIQTRYLGGTLLWDAPLKDYENARYVTYALGVDWGKGGSLEMHVDDLSGAHPVIPNQPIDKMLGSFSGNARFILQCYYPAGSDITVYHENEVVMGRTLESVR